MKESNVHYSSDSLLANLKDMLRPDSAPGTFELIQQLALYETLKLSALLLEVHMTMA